MKEKNYSFPNPQNVCDKPPRDPVPSRRRSSLQFQEEKTQTDIKLLPPVPDYQLLKDAPLTDAQRKPGLLTWIKNWPEFRFVCRIFRIKKRRLTCQKKRK